MERDTDDIEEDGILEVDGILHLDNHGVSHIADEEILGESTVGHSDAGSVRETVDADVRTPCLA